MDQTLEVITRAQRGILLAVPADPPTDAFAAMLGLSLALDRLGKPATVVSPSFVPEHLRFLPGTSQVRDRVEIPAEIILELPLRGAHPHEVRWDEVGDHLRVTVRASAGLAVADRDVRVRSGAYPWDAAVTVGASRLHALGPLYAEHHRFFSETPLLNIDRGTANEFFGTVNLVSSTASTVSEVILELLETLGGVQTLAPEVATCLLAGIAAATDSFRTPTLTPQTFQAASRLLRQDADHQAVVRHLFRTHTLPELRLLGRALARLEELPRDTVLAVVHERDFMETEATPDTMPSILKEILEWAGRTRTAFLAFARNAGTFEVLTFLGQMNPEDRENFRAALGGVFVGPFVLINLGPVPPEQLPQVLRERLLSRLPEPEGTAPVRAAVLEQASGTAGGVLGSRTA
ncbi:MAG: phosphoesterase RecJ domain-containing protein [Parcubacteria group bacterium Gr01-1014_38]|nr:MAG: phosphoesterase RecJ domain-containing protein [Parcubacteria group bacterium Gr01-1014_38]